MANDRGHTLRPGMSGALPWEDRSCHHGMDESPTVRWLRVSPSHPINQEPEGRILEPFKPSYSEISRSINKAVTLGSISYPTRPSAVAMRSSPFPTSR